MAFIARSLLVTCLFMSAANAQQCDINFNYGVIIDPAHLRIVNQGQTYVQINGQHQLFVYGREVALNQAQKSQLSEYTRGIRSQVPAIVSIAIEGVELGLKAVNKVISSLTGENSATHQQFQEKFDEMKSRLRTRFNHSDESYYIAPQDFDDFDEIFAGEFKKEIETIVTNSVGNILVAVGEAITHKEKQSTEQRVETFDQRIESMGNDIKIDISNQANTLENKAAIICASLLKLDQIENKLQLEIPALAEFNLIITH
ncbi:MULTISPECIES: DUF2884 family protein [unclassified Colwellia]|nr:MULTISPECIES: DUF2884 family protein [unclassified Colwellia]MBA6223971.1 YggN family protein [Colwellia sp. MB3u-45]MBA6266122.1 YggN family protein [Colwellia sp. MB3u-43]MBA6289440.1 YggN family protein [Colwellia sp. MB3u-4]MBA6320152.1 YggN family protein [Colwellia sp. MB02u-19]MBA6325963.1 YggN family protein [Colwellia sp. MB02u-18]